MSDPTDTAPADTQAPPEPVAEQATSAPTGEAPASPPGEAPPPTAPVIGIRLLPYQIQIDGGGLPIELVENALLMALAFVKRERDVSRLQVALREEARSIRTAAAIPPGLLRHVR